MDAVTTQVHNDNSHIEIWKIRKLIQKLDNVKGYSQLSPYVLISAPR